MNSAAPQRAPRYSMEAKLEVCRRLLLATVMTLASVTARAVPLAPGGELNPR